MCRNSVAACTARKMVKTIIVAIKWSDKICHNDQRKQRLYEAAYDKLKPLLKENADTRAVEEALKHTDIKQLIEYSRAVHAEMEGIISVARGEKASIVGSTYIARLFRVTLVLDILSQAGLKESCS